MKEFISQDNKESESSPQNSIGEELRKKIAKHRKMFLKRALAKMTFLQQKV